MISITTPALLFGAISLMMLAYTNRFLAIANMIRQLHTKHLQFPDRGVIVGQIQNLRKRLNLIRYMQVAGVSSFFCCVLSMIMIFLEKEEWGSIMFGMAMVLLLVSLAISFWEIQISTEALDLELSEMDKAT